MSYTGFMQVTVAKDSVAADIPTMREMGAAGYANYLEELFFVDHHDVLRATHGEYPFATSPEQVDLLIDYLKEIRAGMVDGRS